MRKAVNKKDVMLKIKLIRWRVGQICEASAEPTWVSNHTNLILKSHLSFREKFWWSIIRWQIRPILTDNMIVLERAIQLARIPAGYEID